MYVYGIPLDLGFGGGGGGGGGWLLKYRHDPFQRLIQKFRSGGDCVSVHAGYGKGTGTGRGYTPPPPGAQKLYL